MSFKRLNLFNALHVNYEMVMILKAQQTAISINFKSSAEVLPIDNKSQFY